MLDRGQDPAELRNDPTALAPESLLVFELQKSHIAFARAISTVPGLKIYAEDIADILTDVGDDLEGHFYLVLPDQEALRQLLRLWELWLEGGDLGEQHNVWASVFECLHDVRRWGRIDRVSDEDVELLREELEVGDVAEVAIEIELVFNENELDARAQRDDLTNSIVDEGGELLAVSRMPGISYDAVLARLPADSVQRIVDREEGSLADHAEALFVRPQSEVRITYEHEDGNLLNVDAVEPRRPAVAAILDAVPVQNHPAFAAHLEYDDPDDLEARAVGPRVHGTAMVSLIIRGDLENDGIALERRIHFRPLLFSRINGDREEEVFRPDRLIVDEVVRAVKRMKEGENGEPPTAPNVIFINISLGDLKRPFYGRLSPWARALDWLAYKYGTLFLISGGNASTLVVAQAASEDEYRALIGEERAQVTLAGVRDGMRDRRVLSPAESVNNLTIGAAHNDAIEADETIGYSLDPLPIQRGTSPFSRLGLGFRNAVKPDFVMPGGRLRAQTIIGERPVKIRCSLPNRYGGLRVAGSQLDAAGRPGFDAWSGGTSGATALATRAAIRIYDALEEAYPEQFMELTNAAKAMVVKALLAHRCSYCSRVRPFVENVFGPTDARRHQKRRANVQRQFGLGEPDIEEVVACIGNRATLWGAGSVGENDAAEFVVPLPGSMSGRRGLRKLTATVAWFSPIRSGIRAYKSVRLVVQQPYDPVHILTGATQGQPRFERSGTRDLVSTVMGRSPSQDVHRGQQRYRSRCTNARPRY